ncbi:hypothetical protein BRC83_06930 [Halobacteriales archaeon QS_1_68_17]|nr:MAG: hypothetical protein BRC83_06930 [Halobacteriales archaeon QS_1_68_17]
MKREGLVWALVLSVPPGIGVVGFTTVLTGGGLVTSTGAVAGAVTTAVIFLFVAAATAMGEADARSPRDGTG